MKSIKVVLEIVLDPDAYDSYKEKGYTEAQITDRIASDLESARIESRLIYDFTVAEMGEIKE